MLKVSHDKVNRLLNEGAYTGKDLFDKAAPNLVLEGGQLSLDAVSYTHLRAHETVLDLVCRLLLEKKKNRQHKATR